MICNFVHVWYSYGMRVCKTCGVDKPDSEYSRDSTPNGGWLRRECKRCNYARYGDRKRLYAKEYARTHKIRKRETELMRKFGITPGDVEIMRTEQGNRCAICGCNKPTGKGDWHVDHNKTTKAIRGLLCSKCNQAIGLLDHSVEILQKAIRYLASQPRFIVLRSK